MSVDTDKGEGIGPLISPEEGRAQIDAYIAKCAAFTPGPWQTKHDYTLEGATTIVANVDGEIHSDGAQTYAYDFICTCEDEFGEYLPNAKANARLIAKAPTMHAALKRIATLRPAGDITAATNLRALVQQIECIAISALGGDL
jgi:hypothetical protein